VNISGTELREKLKKGDLPDPGIMRPETARVLAEKYKSMG
jgi:ATP sulfurylase